VMLAAIRVKPVRWSQVVSRGLWLISAATVAMLFAGAIIELKVDAGVRDDSGRLEGRNYEGSYSSTCVWRVSADRQANDPSLPLGGASFAILTIILWPASAGDGPAKYLQSFRDAALNGEITTRPLPLRIGDEALWWGDGVAVRKCNLSFGISVHLRNGRSKERQMEESLANKIVERL
jgi:hypothetical protein